MTEREIELYEMLRGIIPFAYKEAHLVASDRKRYDAITAYLEANCAHLKIEAHNRREAAMSAAGWSKTANGWEGPLKVSLPQRHENRRRVTGVWGRLP